MSFNVHRKPTNIRFLYFGYNEIHLAFIYFYQHNLKSDITLQVSFLCYSVLLTQLIFTIFFSSSVIPFDIYNCKYFRAEEAEFFGSCNLCGERVTGAGQACQAGFKP